MELASYTRERAQTGGSRVLDTWSYPARVRKESLDYLGDASGRSTASVVVQKGFPGGGARPAPGTMHSIDGSNVVSDFRNIAKDFVLLRVYHEPQLRLQLNHPNVYRQDSFGVPSKEECLILA